MPIIAKSINFYSSFDTLCNILKALAKKIYSDGENAN